MEGLIRLSREEGTVGMEKAVWSHLLRLAGIYGFSGDCAITLDDAALEPGGQVTVTASEAAELADSLFSSLDDLPDFDAAQGMSVECDWLDDDLSPIEFFSGENKQVVDELACFFATGGFELVVRRQGSE